MHRWFVAVLGAAALTVAGCGGDDGGAASSSSSGGAPAALTKAEYITKADAICRDTQKRLGPVEDDLDALPKDSQGRGKPKQIAPILARILDATNGGYERLKALPAPAEDRATLNRWLASTLESTAALEDLQTAVRAGDRAQAEGPGKRVESITTEQRRLARQYGFKDCRSAASTD